MENINNEIQVMEKLGIESLNELNKEENLKKLIEMVNKKEISEVVAKEFIQGVPSIVSSFASVINAMGDIGKSLEETKRVRWDFLKEAAKTNTLSGEQMIEAMKIIENIEEKEGIDWNSIFKGGALAIAGVGLWLLSSGKIKPTL